MIKGEFPPGLRYASIVTHCLPLVHERTNDSLSTAILLVNVWCTGYNLDASVLEHICEGF